MSPADISAAAVFALCWLLYEPALKRISTSRGAINHDMIVVRAAWLKRMMSREMRLMDANLLGQLLNSASFFASTNLIIIAAVAGVLFGGRTVIGNLSGSAIVSAAPLWVLEFKIALILVTLARGLLDFIWAIRQFNYCAALIGAAPEHSDAKRREEYVRAIGNVFDPALSAFNKGVRAYYFALAATAWVASPWAMMAGVLAAVILLLRRQVSSQAARGVRAARIMFEAEAREEADR